jgi:hypothetical protein
VVGQLVAHGVQQPRAPVVAEAAPVVQAAESEQRRDGPALLQALVLPQRAQQLLLLHLLLHLQRGGMGPCGCGCAATIDRAARRQVGLLGRGACAGASAAAAGRRLCAAAGQRQRASAQQPRRAPSHLLQGLLLGQQHRQLALRLGHQLRCHLQGGGAHVGPPVVGSQASTVLRRCHQAPRSLI